MRQATCHPESRHKARGLCVMCYARTRKDKMRAYWQKRKQPCAKCGTPCWNKLCQFCYDLGILCRPANICPICKKLLSNQGSNYMISQCRSCQEERNRAKWYNIRRDEHQKSFAKITHLNILVQRSAEKKDHCRARILDGIARWNFNYPVRLDKFADMCGEADALRIFPCTTFSPDKELIWKEELEEQQKNELYKRYIKCRDSRVDFAKPIDVNEQHIYKLLSTAPLPKRGRGKLRGAITKFSPERGATQRHVKMSPVHFV